MLSLLLQLMTSHLQLQDLQHTSSLSSFTQWPNSSCYPAKGLQDAVILRIRSMTGQITSGGKAAGGSLDHLGRRPNEPVESHYQDKTCPVGGRSCNQNRKGLKREDRKKRRDAMMMGLETLRTQDKTSNLVCCLVVLQRSRIMVITCNTFSTEDLEQLAPKVPHSIFSNQWPLIIPPHGPKLN